MKARTPVLGSFLLLSWLLLLANAGTNLSHVQFQGALATTWILAVWLTYSFFYLVPVFLPIFLLSRFLRSSRGVDTALFVAAWLGASVVQLLVFADAFVFRSFNFHFNGFVWNLITTPGGIESMGASGATQLTFAVIALAWVLAELALLRVDARSRRFASLRRAMLPLPPRWSPCSPRVLSVVAIAEKITYGLADSRELRPRAERRQHVPLLRADAT